MGTWAAAHKANPKRAHTSLCRPCKCGLFLARVGHQGWGRRAESRQTGEQQDTRHSVVTAHCSGIPPRGPGLHFHPSHSSNRPSVPTPHIFGAPAALSTDKKTGIPNAEVRDSEPELQDQSVPSPLLLCPPVLRTMSEDLDKGNTLPGLAEQQMKCREQYLCFALNLP